MTEQTGVFYRTEDYLGVGKRLLIDIVDAVVAIAVSLLFTALLIFVWPHERSLGLVVFIAWLLVWFAYFVLLKRSRFRTLGYRVAGARIVNLQGETPSIFNLVIRLALRRRGSGEFCIRPVLDTRRRVSASDPRQACQHLCRAHRCCSCRLRKNCLSNVYDARNDFLLSGDSRGRNIQRALTRTQAR